MIPRCPEQLPANISTALRSLGRMWAECSVCPHIAQSTKTAWDSLLREWADDPLLPLLVRKSSLVRGSQINHSSGRSIVPTDNSPAQWVCHLALLDIVPSIQEIRDSITNDEIPVSFAHKSNERTERKYHRTLGRFSINKHGWQLCHIQDVGLNSRTPLEHTQINDLKAAFISLLSPTNFFVVPKEWGGMGDTVEFIEAFRNASSPNHAL
jgi:hypothetical protein